jgi:hypothetical protein
MSTPELEQAIMAARWRGAEANFTEAIAKMLEMPPEVVARVVFAWEAMKRQPLADPIEDQSEVPIKALRGELEHGGDLPRKTRYAIEHAAAWALRRMVIRWRMERDLALQVPFKKLVPAERPDRICEGCLHQFECVRDSLSTPNKCLDGARVLRRDPPGAKKLRFFQHQNASVKAVKLDDNVVTVTTDHPRGTFRVSVMDVLV